VRQAVPLFHKFHDSAQQDYPAAAPRLAVYDALRRLLNAFVTDLMCETGARVTAQGATTLEDIRRAPARLASLSAEMENARATTKKFLYANLYNSPGMEELHERAAYMVQSVFGYLMNDPSLLPEDHRAQIPVQGLARTVADYIAGMTDAFIEQLWERCGGR
jgi:dGTPase